MTMRNAIWAAACYDAMHGWRADCASQRPVFAVDEDKFKRGIGELVMLRYKLELTPLLHALTKMELLIHTLEREMMMKTDYLDYRQRRVVHEEGNDKIIYGSKGHNDLPQDYKADHCLMGDERQSSVPTNVLSLQGLLL